MTWTIDDNGNPMWGSGWTISVDDLMFDLWTAARKRTIEDAHHALVELIRASNDPRG